MQERKKQKKSAAAEAATRAAAPPYNLAQARKTQRGYHGRVKHEDPGEARGPVGATLALRNVPLGGFDALCN